MVVIVRCAGGGRHTEGGTVINADFAWMPSTPCGWQGSAEAADTGSTHAEGNTVIHEYRCPKCGGRVELIHKEEPAADGAA